MLLGFGEVACALDKATVTAASGCHRKFGLARSTMSGTLARAT